LSSQSLAKQLFQLFIVNDEAYGVEDENGWRTVKAKLTLENIEDHLKGKYCLGIFPFNKKGIIRWFALDLDYKGGELHYEYLCKKFGKQSILMVDTGGRGTHIFVLLQPTPLWKIANELNTIENDLKRRIFPKQREWHKDMLGNFIRLPLSRHFKTGNWSKIVKGDIWKVKPYKVCTFMIYDQHGDANCTYYDSSIGYCQQDLCPKMERTFEGFEVSDMFASLQSLNGSWDSLRNTMLESMRAEVQVPPP